MHAFQEAAAEHSWNLTLWHFCPLCTCFCLQTQFPFRILKHNFLISYHVLEALYYLKNILQKLHQWYMVA